MSDEIIKREQKAISLNEENKQLKKEIENLKLHLREREELLCTQIQVIEEKLEKAISALEFYANRENWQDLNERTEPNNATNIIGDSDEYGMDKWCDDYLYGGKLARQTLMELKGA